MAVVATAGHVDHGKSTLVRALTGIDPDRFAEEKARGLTIDIGFASTTLPSGSSLSLVDVPGHIKFIKNMLAGVGAVDACLFVVAANEGWKPQSEEHLRILEILGITKGVVALTKIGLADPELLEIAKVELEDHLQGSFLEHSELVEVDALSGYGIDQLRKSLDSMLSSIQPRPNQARPRLWIDRCFISKGAGTIVTGTLIGGKLAQDDEVLVVSSAKGSKNKPNTIKTKIRGLQNHNQRSFEIEPAKRAAVNLSGISHENISRGDALIKPEQWELNSTFDCSLKVLKSINHKVNEKGAYSVYIGSGEHSTKLKVIGSKYLEPGQNGLIRLYLSTCLPLLPGDRYVLRESGRGETIGGGEILDISPILSLNKAQPDKDPERIIKERGWITAPHLEKLSGIKRLPQIGGTWLVSQDALNSTMQSINEKVKNSDSLGLDIALLNPQEKAVLELMEDLIVENGRVIEKKSVSITEKLSHHVFIKELEKSLFMPPSPQQLSVDRAELRQMVKLGLVIEQDGLYFSPIAVEQACQNIIELLKENPLGVTVSQIRQKLGTSRKFLFPLLIYLDSNGFTKRRQDLRIAGPRLKIN